MPTTKPSTVPIFILAALSAMAPLAIDAYLPAMPEMAEGLSTSIHNIELSLSLFLAGFALGQIIGGPLSDHFGRRFGIFSGITLFAIGSCGITLCADIETLWGFRITQALGAGLMGVNGPAVIRDLSEGQNSARYLSHMAVIMMIAPLVAPMLGMMILQIAPWQGIFLFLLIFSLLVALAVFIRLPETRVHDENRPSIWQRYRQILIHRRALSFVAAQSFSYAGMFAFITASPLVYMTYFDVSQQLYPFLFSANVIAMIIINRINVLLLKTFASRKILIFGQLLQISSGCALLAYLLFASTPQLAFTVVLIVCFVGCQSFIVANATANTIQFFPTNSGTAAALLGASSFLAGAIGAGLVGILGDGSALPMAIVMCGCALLGGITRLVLYGNPQTH